MKKDNIYTIAANQSFFDVLVSGLVKRFTDSEVGFADIIILVPSRRSIKDLRSAFLKFFSGKPILLPSIIAIGDINEEEITLISLLNQPLDQLIKLPAPINKQEQIIYLSKLIYKYHQKKGLSIEQSVDLARELSAFLAELQRENIDLSKLEKLVDHEVAIHWQQIMEFLLIITDYWPKILASKNMEDPVSYRNLLVEMQSRFWQSNPPAKTIIAAGSTGTVKTTAVLLKTIANLERGMVVIPYIDMMLDEDSWEKIDEFHPQFNIKQLLSILQVKRADIVSWDKSYFFAPSSRLKLLSEMMRSKSSCNKWNELQSIEPQALEGLDYIICDNLQQEANVIALIIRHVLEEPQKTIALVTNERNLAMRVISILTKYNIDIDDSAGIALSNAPPMVFLRLVAEMVLSDFAPIATLSALKHPFAAGFMRGDIFRNLIREIEMLVLRGVRIMPGIKGIISSLEKQHKPQLVHLLQQLFPSNNEFLQLMQAQAVNFKDLLTAHISLAQHIATSDEQSGEERLWQGDIGLTSVEFLQRLVAASSELGQIKPHSYNRLFESFLVGQLYHPRYGRHPRVTILSPTESRFYHQDVIIIGALNEGNWPEHVKAGPWLSRKMRRKLGLPALERLVGQMGFDFYYLSAAKQVYFTRSLKSEGAETVPSRWILRLQTLLKKFNLTLKTDSYWQELAKLIYLPDQVRPCQPTQANPAAKLRPQKLSVTEIEKLMRDPYSIYAKHVLKLKKLDAIDADPGAADFGNFIHQALENFSLQLQFRQNKHEWFDLLIASGKQVLSMMIERPSVRILWWPRFERIASWIIDREIDNIEQNSLYAEVRGKKIFHLKQGDFTLTAKADRLEISSQQNIAILDYKTGNIPSLSAIEKGISPQMALEALIAADAGFSAQDPAICYKITKLVYIYLSGGEIPAEESEITIDIDQLIEEARVGVESLITVFSDQNTPYHASPLSDRILRYNDYEHLARNKEWVE
jgi:ATP-dependent helicase/nuclease subunit B